VFYERGAVQFVFTGWAPQIIEWLQQDQFKSELPVVSNETHSELFVRVNKAYSKEGRVFIETNEFTVHSDGPAGGGKIVYSDVRKTFQLSKSVIMTLHGETMNTKDIKDYSYASYSSFEGTFSNQQPIDVKNNTEIVVDYINRNMHNLFNRGLFSIEVEGGAVRVMDNVAYAN